MGRMMQLTRRASQQVAFRATLISLLAVVLALLARILAPLIPYEFSLGIGAQAVDDLLTILASSMLVVTTFSMTAMVTAFNAASQNVTPRAAKLLIEDKAAQNALSTFLGGFVFGIVGIIALSTGYYGAEGQAILYIGTILMIVWIVAVLLRWIHRLTTFGRMEDTIRRVERAAVEAIDRHPGGVLLATPDEAELPAHAITGDRIGYVTYVDLEALEGAFGDQAGELRVCAPPGTFVDQAFALARSQEPLSDECRRAIVAAFTIEPVRDFRYDPRFGLITLSEIASRALSPAVNDPGSAIAVLDAGWRVLHRLVAKHDENAKGSARIAWALKLDEMTEDLIRPIARDGAGMAEVGIRLQRLLGSISREVGGNHPALEALSRDALEEARSSGMAPPDLARVERARGQAFDL